MWDSNRLIYSPGPKLSNLHPAVFLFIVFFGLLIGRVIEKKMQELDLPIEDPARSSISGVSHSGNIRKTHKRHLCRTHFD